MSELACQPFTMTQPLIKNPPSVCLGDFFYSTDQDFLGASFLCSENHLHLWMHHHGVTMNRPSAFVFLSGWAPLVAQSREHNIRAWHRSPWGQRCSSSSSGMGKGICLSPRWRYRKESGPIPYPTQDTGEPGRGQAHRYDRIFFIAFPVDHRGSKRIRL